MKIVTSIKLSQLNPSKVKIDKLFQVIFIGESNINQSRKVEVFTALVARFSTWNKKDPQISVEITIDGMMATNDVDVSKDLYEEIDILNQFWGKDSSKPGNPEVFRNTLVKEIPALGQKNIDNQIMTISENQDNKNLRQLIIKELDKNIEPFILLPQKLSNTDQNYPRLLPLDIEISELVDLCMYISPAIWIRSTFDTKNNVKKLNNIIIPIEHTMHFNSPLECDDFKIYYVFPSQFQVSNSSANGNYINLFPSQTTQGNDLDNPKAEINEVFSQPNTKYFKLWESLGIQDSTLLRLRNSTAVDRVFKEGKVNTIRLQFRMTDTASGEKRENKKLIISIWLSTLIALGIDSTRLAENSKYFPDNTYFNAPFWWALLCISLSPKFIPPIKSYSPRISRFLGNLTLVGYLSWTSVAFFMGQKSQEFLLASKWLPLLLFITIVCGGLTFLLQRTKIPKKGINK